MKSKIYIRVISLILCGLMPVACTSRMASLETCARDTGVYTHLVTNQQAWIEYFSLKPLSSSNAINFMLDGNLYVVRSLFQTSTGQPVLSIATSEGWPRTHLGTRGYLYTATGELNFDDNRYLLTKLSDNVYCYERQ